MTTVGVVVEISKRLACFPGESMDIIMLAE